MNTNRPILAVLLLAGVLLTSNAWAAQAGRVQFVNGDVQVTNAAGQAHAMQKGEPVNEGDTVVSAKDASAQVKMQDGGFVAIRPDTRLKFDSFKFSGKQDEPENSVFSLFKGGFRAITGLIGRIHHQDYRINTPVATIGIRGTDHETVVVLPNDPLAATGQAPAGTYNKVNVGETSITTDAGSVNVLPNQMGYAGAPGQMPQLQPVNTNLFTVTPPPAPQSGGGKGGSDNGTRDTAVVDTAAETASGNTTTTASPQSGNTLPGLPPPTVVPALPSTASAFSQGVYTNLDGIETTVAPHPAGSPPANTELLPFPAGGTYTFDATGLTLVNCGVGCFIGIGTAQNVDVGGVAGVIEWGRWSNGVMSAGGWYNGMNMGPNQGWHYLVGAVTPLVQIPVTGTFTYNLLGGTSPTPSDGVGGGLGLGHLVSGAVSINFGTMSVNGNLVMGFNGASTYQATYNGSVSSTGLTLSGLTTFQSGSINVCGTGGCSSQYVGQFFGANAAYLGVGYMITTPQNFNINGVVAYQR